jgi:hypothetical protein
MDCPLSFWPNRAVDQIRQEAAYMSEKKTGNVTEELQSGRRTVGIVETRRIACATLQNAVVAGVLMFYSRSVLGAVIRACVGA